jgi:hypothetical protein
MQIQDAVVAVLALLMQKVSVGVASGGMARKCANLIL